MRSVASFILPLKLREWMLFNFREWLVSYFTGFGCIRRLLPHCLLFRQCDASRSRFKPVAIRCTMTPSNCDTSLAIVVVLPSIIYRCGV